MNLNSLSSKSIFPKKKLIKYINVGAEKFLDLGQWNSFPREITFSTKRGSKLKNWVSRNISTNVIKQFIFSPKFKYIIVSTRRTTNLCKLLVTD